MLTFKEKALFHQIHPAKVATDVTAEILSLILLWEHFLVYGLVVHFVPCIIASLLLVGFADLEWIKTSFLGAYVGTYITRPIEALRFLSDILMVIGAWYHIPLLIGLALALISGCWCNGLIWPRRIA